MNRSPGQKRAKQTAPQAVERKKESLPKQKTSQTNCSTGRKKLPPTAPEHSDSSDTTVSFVDHIPSPNIIAEFYGNFLCIFLFHSLFFTTFALDFSYQISRIAQKNVFFTANKIRNMIAHAEHKGNNPECGWVGSESSRHRRRLQALRSADTLKREKFQV